MFIHFPGSLPIFHGFNMAWFAMPCPSGPSGDIFPGDETGSTGERCFGDEGVAMSHYEDDSSIIVAPWPVVGHGGQKKRAPGNGGECCGVIHNFNIPQSYGNCLGVIHNLNHLGIEWNSKPVNVLS